MCVRPTTDDLFEIERAPTGLFAVLETPDQEIGTFLAWKRRETEFESSKSCERVSRARCQG